MDSIYDLVPLKRGDSTNIRVIKILRDGADAHPQGWPACRLYTMSLERPPIYVALSYTWGSPENTKMITLDGRPFEVRENLWNFLCEAQRRVENETTLLWIDAICINQAEVKERNHQVGMMADIYSKAAEVIVWLGSWPKEVEMQMAHTWEASGETDEEVDWDMFLQPVCDSIYWTRVWILQEYILAHSVELWYGESGLAGSDLEDLVLSAPETSPVRRSPAARVINRRAQWHAERGDMHGSRMGLKGLVDRFGARMDCTDARDRVYALLSLVSEEEKSWLTLSPDYAKSSMQLLHELAELYKTRSNIFAPMLRSILTQFQVALELSQDGGLIEEAVRYRERGQDEETAELMRKSHRQLMELNIGKEVPSRRVQRQLHRDRLRDQSGDVRDQTRRLGDRT